MGKLIILFGATGFLGRNLVPYLAARGYDVIAVSRSGGSVEGALGACAMERIDQLKDFGPGAMVINVAAHRYDAENFLTGQSDILTANVGLYNAIYQYCIRRGIKEVRNASSVAVYSAALRVLDDAVEIDLDAPPHRGEAFYAWSKRWGEIVGRLYRDAGRISTINFRLSNPYGPHDSLDCRKAHVLPAFIMKALSSEPCFEILGNADASRDFIYSSDVCDVFYRSLEWEGRTEAFNLCTGTQTTLLDLAETVMAAAKVHKPIKIATEKAGGVVKRAATAVRVREAFGIAAFTSLEAGLGQTVDWYRRAGN